MDPLTIARSDMLLQISSAWNVSGCFQRPHPFVRSDMDNFNPSSTIGALEGGIIVTNLLFGTFTMQVHIYYRKFPQDYRPLKTLVTTK
jgi:hypothetical protein